MPTGNRPHIRRAGSGGSRPTAPDGAARLTHLELTRDRVVTDRRGTARLLFHLEAVGRLTGTGWSAGDVAPSLEPHRWNLRPPEAPLEELLPHPPPRHSRRTGSEALDCVVADDHPIVGQAVADVLARHGVTVVGCARTGLEAIELIEEKRPAVALVDLRLPGFDGAEVARRVSRTAPETALILYTGADPLLLSSSLESGARGFLLKEAPLGDLPRAVKMVAQGQIYIDPALATFLARSPAAQGLDGRELEILRLLAGGLTAEEIARRMFFSPETVRGHLRRAMAKLHAHTRTEAVAAAVRQKLIS